MKLYIKLNKLFSISEKKKMSRPCYTTRLKDKNNCGKRLPCLLMAFPK